MTGVVYPTGVDVITPVLLPDVPYALGTGAGLYGEGAAVAATTGAGVYRTVGALVAMVGAWVYAVGAGVATEGAGV